MLLSEAKIQEFLGAFPAEFMSLSATDRRISAQIYRLLAKGEPVTTEALASSLDLSHSRVLETVSKWSGLFYDKNEAIIGYWGLTLLKMPHRFEVDGVNLFTGCAWDALFIPQILGKTANVVSLDPLTREEVHITVSPDGIEALSPETAVTSFMVPATDEIRSDVINSFCNYLHFFASEDSAKAWIGGNKKSDDLVILSIEEGFKIGVEKNKLQYADELLQAAPSAL